MGNGTNGRHGAPEELASLAQLVYINDDQPGFLRQRRGKGFSYYDASGQRVSNSALLDRFKALAIPPAWRAVWICTDPAGHIQVTGRDDRSRKQYIYHPRWELVRNQAKYSRLLAFAKALPALRTQVNQDLQKRTLSREKVIAIVISLLDKTRIRIGNPEYTRQNETYGLTTLQDDHVDIAGARLIFTFRGKSKREHTVEIEDRRLARLVKQCQELPGQELFQYRAEDGQWHALHSHDVNDYLRLIMGEAFSAKDFRTWAGTVTVATALHAIGPAANTTEHKRNLAQAIKHAAAELGNTTTVCRKYYVHPAVLAAYADGTLFPVMQRAIRRAPNAETNLTAAETAVLTLLRKYPLDSFTEAEVVQCQ